MSEELLTMQAMVKATCIALDTKALVDKIKISFYVRGPDLGGEAFFDTNEIKINLILWASASRRERYELVVHEVCHLAAFYKDCRARNHGRMWKSLMVKMGLKPSRYFYCDSAPSKTKALFRLRCGCSEDEIAYPELLLLTRSAKKRCPCKKFSVHMMK